MDMIMNQEHKIRRSSFQFKTLFSYLISVVFVFILLCLRMVDFTGFSISFPSFNPGRTHMFLLCNGIVLILVKGSLLATPDELGVGAHYHLKEKMDAEKVQVECEVIEERHVNSDELVLGIQEEEEDGDGEKTSNGCVLIIAETQQIHQQLVEDEEDGIEEEELSVEELNIKCDEFIKKMRQVLCNRQ